MVVQSLINPGSQHRRPHRWIIPITVVALLFSWVVLSPTSAFAETDAPLSGTISGVVVTGDDNPVPAGTVVKLYEPESDEVIGRADLDDDGSFSLGPVARGLYVLRAVPPVDSGYTKSLPKAASVIRGGINVGRIKLTQPQLRGVVVAPDSDTPVPATVSVYLGNRIVFQHVKAPEGKFEIGGLPRGSYALIAHPAVDRPLWHSERVVVNIAPDAPNEPVVLQLTEADLWGTVQTTEGRPVHQAKVTVARGDGEHRADETSESGFWAIGGLDDGDYRLRAFPPAHRPVDLLPSETVGVSLPGAENPYTLVLGESMKVVKGVVMTNLGDPVENAQIVARRVEGRRHAEALTGADGGYKIELDPGVWALTVRAIDGTKPADWVYPGEPQLVVFRPNDVPEAKEVNFTVLTADAKVIGEIQMPDGSVPPFKVTIGLHSDEGVGLRTEMADDGSFGLSLPHGGYKVFIHTEDRSYLGPKLDPIRVPPEETLDLGIITLVTRDATITGRVTAGDEGIEGVPVVAYQRGVIKDVGTRTGPDGIYAMTVTSGTWHIQPAPGPRIPYIYNGDGAEVEVASGETVENVDFELVAADSLIVGAIVDEEGNVITEAHGWVKAHHVETERAAENQRDARPIRNGAPIIDGLFRLAVAPGTYNVVAHLAPGSDVVSAGERNVTVEAGETVRITLEVKRKTAQIGGALWNPRTDEVVSGVAGYVAAWWSGHVSIDRINEENGSYVLNVAPGLWHVNYRIDPRDGYVKLAGTRNVAVSNTRTATVPLPLPVLPRTSKLSGKVLAPDGSPMPSAVVWIKGTEGDVKGLRLKTKTNREGIFEMAAPSGEYRLGAAYGDTAWVKPVERNVTLADDVPSTGHVLQFQEPDARLVGTLTAENVTLSERRDAVFYVWAWSTDGGFTRGKFRAEYDATTNTATGEYQLGVTTGTTWTVGAVLESNIQFWRGRNRTEVTANPTTLDVTLEGPKPKPAPVVVSFDAADPQRIELADGTNIFIPAGAMPVEGQVTLRMVPLAAVPHQRNAEVVDYGIAFIATDETGAVIEEHFNQEVAINFPYDESKLPDGVNEADLKPAYFSTTENLWTRPDSFVIDTDANTITMQVDHFTDFAVLADVGASAVTESQDEPTLLLPMVSNNP